MRRVELILGDGMLAVEARIKSILPIVKRIRH